MRSLKCDMWLEQADALCITTNGIVKANGQAVMGKGVAKEAVQRFYGIQTLLGKKLQRRGSRVHLLTRKDRDIPYIKLPRKNEALKVATPWHLVSFPTKGHWKDASDLKLIATSCKQLKKLVDKMGWEVVLLPRPGCSNGNLNWKDVKSIVKEYFGFDDRIVIVHNPTTQEKKNNAET